MILTKPTARSTQRPAIPMGVPSRGFAVSQCALKRVVRQMHLEDLETLQHHRPRLGGRIGLAWRWDPSNASTSLKVSGRSGASPHQIRSPSHPRNYAFVIAE
jgi:hypothetical protein